MSSSGQLLTSTSNWSGGQVFWHPHTGKPLLRTRFRYAPDATVQDGRLFDVAIDKTRLTLPTVEPSPVFRTFVPDPAGLPLLQCRDVTVHPNGRLIAVGHSNGVSLFDLPTGLEVGLLDLKWNLFAHFDPSNGDLLTYGPRSLFRWPVRIKTGTPETIVVGSPRWLGAGSIVGNAEFDVSRDGKVIVVANDTRAVVYRQEASGLKAITLGPLTDNRGARVSPDGRWALTSTHAALGGLVWDARTGQRGAKVRELRNDPESGAFFSGDGCWLTNGRRRWAVETWEEGPPTPLADEPTAKAFAPDGRSFAGQSDDESVHLIDASTGKTLVRLGLPEQSRTWHAAFSPDRSQLIHQSTDHFYVCAWDLRVLRRHLAELDLDWDAPPFPPAPTAERRLPPVVIVEPIDPSLRPEVVVEPMKPEK